MINAPFGKGGPRPTRSHESALASPDLKSGSSASPDLMGMGLTSLSLCAIKLPLARPRAVELRLTQPNRHGPYANSPRSASPASPDQGEDTFSIEGYPSSLDPTHSSRSSVKDLIRSTQARYQQTDKDESNHSGMGKSAPCPCLCDQQGMVVRRLHHDLATRVT